MRYDQGMWTLLFTLISTPVLAEDSSRIWQYEKHFIGVNAYADNITQIRITEGTPSEADVFATSPMVEHPPLPAPKDVKVTDASLTTPFVSVKPDTEGKCVEVFDQIKEVRLTKVCTNLTRRRPALKISQDETTHLYGLGEQFINHGNADGDWLTLKERYPGNAYGNEQTFLGLDGGKTGNAEFPVLYAVGPGNTNYAMMIDSHYPNIWDFSKDPWKVSMRTRDIRLIFITGKNLPELRQTFMELTGKPPVPPRKMFGLWVSEYGYESWSEVDRELKLLRKERFPIDGFVLDLQWFGGKSQSPDTQMGSFTWDEDKFPKPAEQIANYHAQNIGLIAIEEPYVGQRLQNHNKFAEKQYLVASMDKRKCDKENYQPILLDAWWGVGGMIDFTNPHLNTYLHDQIRIPNMIKLGLIGHWTDLGEPETFTAESCYHGFTDERSHVKHTSIHNFYNLFWSKGIYEGYVRNSEQVKQRPFIMSRSGTIGSQRYGVSMWSGDIGSDLESLKSQYNAQMHMSLSGIDYFGSDVGGFIRMGGHHIQMKSYTQWFANSAWIDIPVRPHTYNLDNIFTTNPADMGHVKSNLENIRERYRWTPYYYSLAHRAHQFGEPLVPPAIYYYQNDKELIGKGNYKMLGKDVLIRTFAESRHKKVDMYLPKGQWVNYRTNEVHDSAGESIGDVPIKSEESITQVPVFIKSGAIIPQMLIPDTSIDINGQQPDKHDDADARVVKVYPGAAESDFILFEDDGKTNTYDKNNRPVYAVRSTRYSQAMSDKQLKFTAAASTGTYTAAKDKTAYLVMFAIADQKVASVKVGETTVAKSTFDVSKTPQDSAWHINDRGELWVAVSNRPVSEPLEVVVALQ